MTQAGVRTGFWKLSLGTRSRRPLARARTRPRSHSGSERRLTLPSVARGGGPGLFVRNSRASTRRPRTYRLVREPVVLPVHDGLRRALTEPASLDLRMLALVSLLTAYLPAWSAVVGARFVESAGIDPTAGRVGARAAVGVIRDIGRLPDTNARLAREIHPRERSRFGGPGAARRRRPERH
jgi:hypothetical protein